MATSIYAFPYISTTMSKPDQQDVPLGSPVEMGALNSLCPPTMSEQEEQDVSLGHSLAMGSVDPVYPPQVPLQDPPQASSLLNDKDYYGLSKVCYICIVCASGCTTLAMAEHYLYLGASANTTGFSYAGCVKGLTVAGCSFSSGAALAVCGLWAVAKGCDKLMKNDNESESLQPLLMNEGVAALPQYSIPEYSK